MLARVPPLLIERERNRWNHNDRDRAAGRGGDRGREHRQRLPAAGREIDDERASSARDERTPNSRALAGRPIRREVLVDEREERISAYRLISPHDTKIRNVVVHRGGLSRSRATEASTEQHESALMLRGAIERRARSHSIDSQEGTTGSAARPARQKSLWAQRQHHPAAHLRCDEHRRNGAPDEAAQRHPLIRRTRSMPTAALLRCGRKPLSAGRWRVGLAATERLGLCACHLDPAGVGKNDHSASDHVDFQLQAAGNC